VPYYIIAGLIITCTVTVLVENQRAKMFRPRACLARSTRSSRRRGFLPVGAFASLASVVVADYCYHRRSSKEHENESPSSLWNNSNKSFEQFSLLPLSRTCCDESPSYLSGLWGGGFKRQETADRIQELADKRSLKSSYNVDWNAPLGEGAFGAVYAASEKKTNVSVALKKISKEFTNDTGFQREMDAFLTIRQNGGHPNICGLHDYFDEGDHYYLTLDMISGGEMFDHLIHSGVRYCYYYVIHSSPMASENILVQSLFLTHFLCSIFLALLGG
jgi:hypothetical protein